MITSCWWKLGVKITWWWHCCDNVDADGACDDDDYAKSDEDDNDDMDDNYDNDDNEMTT